MHYMAAHGLRRARPAELVPGTVRVITARMDYLPQKSDSLSADWVDHEMQRLQQPTQAVVSVYARGRDYHKVMRKRLQTLGERLAETVSPLGFRVFTDSAPVLEAAIWAENVPFHETRDYVKKVLSNTTSYAALLSGQPQSLKARLGTVAPREASAPPIDDKMP